MECDVLGEIVNSHVNESSEVCALMVIMIEFGEIFSKSKSRERGQSPII